MLGFFASVHYAPSMESLILTREDDTADPKNPSSILKTIAISEIVNTEHEEFDNELTLTFRENSSILTIHVPLRASDITPEMRSVLRL
jgi:hypothetical protein